MCIEQLTYAGVFEAVQIRKSGFPFRLPHRRFANRYRCLAYKETGWVSLGTRQGDYKGMCSALLRCVNQVRRRRRCCCCCAFGMLMVKGCTLDLSTSRMFPASTWYLFFFCMVERESVLEPFLAFMSKLSVALLGGRCSLVHPRATKSKVVRVVRVWCFAQHGPRDPARQ